MGVGRPPLTGLARQAAELRDLHAGPGLLVLPNVWDVASARAVAAAGFPVVATGSAAVALALGHEDHEHAPVEEMLAAVARIAGAVVVPVSADVEAGYGLAPAELAERLLEAGAAGCNLEDTDHHGESPLLDAERQGERIAALKEAARGAGVDLVVNARVDVFLTRAGAPAERFTEAVRRARIYSAAGADCVYPITLADAAEIAAFVAAVDAPVNIYLQRGTPSLERLAGLGVRRASLGPHLLGAVMRETRVLLDELRHGSVARLLGS